LLILVSSDHDPKGLQISDLRKRLQMMEQQPSVDWVVPSPDDDQFVIDRFGLNADFINRAGLTWIDNLVTSTGKDLANQHHPDHYEPYVQDYIEQFGVHKCEADALVVQPELGRQLARDAIERYVDADAPGEYEAKLEKGAPSCGLALRSRVR
jgi:hypothetical protein